MLKKKVVSKKLFGFVLGERRLAGKFIRQRQNLTFVREHGKWSQRATADRNRSFTELVTYTPTSKEWKVLLETNSNFEYDKTILQINHKN